MFAAFLKEPDGGFAFGRFVISLIALFMTLAPPVFFLPRIVRTGRVPFFGGWGMSRIVYIERKNGYHYH